MAAALQRVNPSDPLCAWLCAKACTTLGCEARAFAELLATPQGNEAIARFLEDGLANDNLSLLIYAQVERPEPVVVNATPVEVLTPELTPPDEEPSPAPEEEPQPIQEGSAAAAEDEEAAAKGEEDTETKDPAESAEAPAEGSAAADEDLAEEVRVPTPELAPEQPATPPSEAVFTLFATVGQSPHDVDLPSVFFRNSYAALLQAVREQDVGVLLYLHKRGDEPARVCMGDSLGEEGWVIRYEDKPLLAFEASASSSLLSSLSSAAGLRHARAFVDVFTHVDGEAYYLAYSPMSYGPLVREVIRVPNDKLRVMCSLKMLTSLDGIWNKTERQNQNFPYGDVKQKLFDINEKNLMIDTAHLLHAGLLSERAMGKRFVIEMMVHGKGYLHIGEADFEGKSVCNGVASTASGSSKALDPANRSNVELGVQLGEVHVDVQRAYETWVESTEWFSKMAVLFVAWMLFLMKQGMRPLRFACDIADVWKYTPFLTLPWDQEVLLAMICYFLTVHKYEDEVKTIFIGCYSIDMCDTMLPWISTALRNNIRVTMVFNSASYTRFEVNTMRAFILRLLTENKVYTASGMLTLCKWPAQLTFHPNFMVFGETAAFIGTAEFTAPHFNQPTLLTSPHMNTVMIIIKSPELKQLRSLAAYMIMIAGDARATLHDEGDGDGGEVAESQGGGAGGNEGDEEHTMSEEEVKPDVEDQKQSVDDAFFRVVLGIVGGVAVEEYVEI